MGQLSLLIPGKKLLIHLMAVIIILKDECEAELYLMYARYLAASNAFMGNLIPSLKVQEKAKNFRNA